MELWELNTCVAEHNKMQAENNKTQVANNWQVANFTGAAFSGKLRKLSTYLKDRTKKSPQKITKEDFNKKLAAAERGRVDGT